MKKIDKLVLSSFIGPFILTFFVVVFILLNIQMLKYFDDIIGKGLEWTVISQLLFYFAVFTTPTALPLAVLLSSLITFGNLGEHFELTAIKSAGISLLRTLQPIFFFVLILTVFAFYINNNLVPKAALEAYSLLYDIKQKKPALELREGAFYMGIPDISIKINKKFHDDESALKGVVIYDHRKNEGNNEVTVADSGRMYTILNERYLKLELYNGYNYIEGASSEQEFAGQKSKGKKTESLSRSKFAKSQVVFDLSSFQMIRTEKKWFQGNRIMRNLSELDSDLDSLNDEVLTQKVNYYSSKPTYFVYYSKDDSITMPPDVVKHKAKNDSIIEATVFGDKQRAEAKVEADSTSNNDSSSINANGAHNKTIPQADTSIRPAVRISKADLAHHAVSSRMVHKKKIEPAPEVFIPPTIKLKASDSVINQKIDSLYTAKNSNEILQRATNSARQVKSQLTNNNSIIDSYTKDMYVYAIQWHKIIASSMACIAMFLIGAPLGAIIKKGGLGVPFLVSILFFIIFYVMNMIGEKWAKQGAVDVITGVWSSDFILLIIGIIFLRQARIDARLFDTDFYLVVFDKFKRWRKERGLLTTKPKGA
jgi:lipopolysaccharide export system permease protein